MGDMLPTGRLLTNRVGMSGKDDMILVGWMRPIFEKHRATPSSIC